MKLNGRTDIGRSRAENQDTFRSGDVPGAGAWGIVCDGMGGAQHGKLAGAVAAEGLEDVLYRRLAGDAAPAPPQELLREAVQQANTRVFARSGGGAEMMGTTVVCAYVRERVLYYAHVGDSRLYLYQHGRLRQLTRDHSMVQELVDLGTITSEEAQHHPERNVITRALGVEGDVAPSCGEEPVDAGDIILLCSDGLSNHVSLEQMQALLEQEDFYEAADRLVDMALAEGGDDNITVLLIQPEERDWQK